MIITEHKMLLFFCGCLLILMIQFARNQKREKKQFLEKAKKTNAFVTAEDHSVIGGLGSAVCEYLSQTCPVPVLRVGVPDHFGESGTQDELYRKYGLTADDIIEAAKKAISMKTTNTKG